MSPTAKKVRVRLVKSPIGALPKHRATVRALGLRKMNRVREHHLTPVIQGMINQVSYLLEVENVGK